MHNKTTISRKSKKSRSAKSRQYIAPPRNTTKSLVCVHTHTDVFKEALYKGYTLAERTKNRMSLCRFLVEHYGVNRQTAYGKLGYWRFEEWEILGLRGTVDEYCAEKSITAPEWSDGEYATDEARERFRIQLVDWFANIPHKMRFYNWLAQRGMCRSSITHIMSGKPISQLKIEGYRTAYIRWVNIALNDALAPLLGIT